MTDWLLPAAIVLSTFVVTPPAVRFVDVLLFRHEAYWHPTPRPAARLPVWRWLTDEGLAWLLVGVVALFPLCLAFGL